MVQPPWERLREKYHERQRSNDAIGKFCLTSINREFIRQEKRLSVGPVLRARLRVSSTSTATPTTGSCRSRPSTRTSRSSPRSDSGRAFPTGMERPDPRLAALRAGGRTAGGGRRAARKLLCRGGALRLPARPAARLFRSSRHVEGYGSRRDHRPRLPPRRARFLGQEPDEHVRGDRAYPAVHPRSAIAGKRPLLTADPVDRHGRHLPRPLRRRAAVGNGGPLAASRRTIGTPSSSAISAVR